MNWVQSLFVIHHQTSKEAEEHFQQCEQDIIDMIGLQPYSQVLEKYTTLLHAKFGNKLTCGVRTCLPASGSATGKAGARVGAGARMVSLMCTVCWHISSDYGLDCQSRSANALVMYNVQGPLLFISFFIIPWAPVVLCLHLRIDITLSCIIVCVCIQRTLIYACLHQSEGFTISKFMTEVCALRTSKIQEAALVCRPPTSRSR